MPIVVGTKPVAERFGLSSLVEPGLKGYRILFRGGRGVYRCLLRVSAVRLYFATLFGLLRISLSSAKVVPK